MNNRAYGAFYEHRCEMFLSDNNVKVLEKNFTYHNKGEVDIIGKDGEYLVFFEVKYRKTTSGNCAEAAVSPAKQRSISRVCDYYLLKNNISPDTAVRFDVLTVYPGNINWYRNAFDYVI